MRSEERRSLPCATSVQNVRAHVLHVRFVLLVEPFPRPGFQCPPLVGDASASRTLRRGEPSELSNIVRVQGYLAHKKTPFPPGPLRNLGIGLR